MKTWFTKITRFYLRNKNLVTFITTVLWACSLICFLFLISQASGCHWVFQQDNYSMTILVQNILKNSNIKVVYSTGAISPLLRVCGRTLRLISMIESSTIWMRWDSFHGSMSYDPSKDVPHKDLKNMLSSNLRQIKLHYWQLIV